MAVFTPLDLASAQTICKNYNLAITHIAPILEGVTNSNFLITTHDNKKYILTIIEQIDFEALTKIVNMLSLLPKKIAMPKLLATLDGKFIFNYAQKPATITEFVLGDYPLSPTPMQIAQIAQTMAYLHTEKQNFSRANPRGFNWMKNTANKIMDKLSPKEAILLTDTLTEIEQFNYHGLPKGIIHHDLFRDNSLFLGDQLTAIIDFYYACHDYLLIDMAITINDWCFDKPDLFLIPYQKIRQLSSQEISALTFFRRYVCVNFWLSRLIDVHYPIHGATLVKDPDAMRDKLVLLN